MKIKNVHITKGFILSGLLNILGVLIFSRIFSNNFIPAFDNQAMSNFGLLMIVLWGFAKATNSFGKLCVFGVKKGQMHSLLLALLFFTET